MPFTDRQIGAFKPKQERYEKVEPGRTGLRIRVTPRGVKTWTYLYRFGGKQHRMVFGTYPVMGVAKAHSALAGAREMLLAGIDPGAVVAEERATERGALTMEDLATEYLEHRVRPKMRPNTIAEETRILAREIIPHLGTHKADKITRRSLNLLLDEIEARGTPAMRNRVKGVLTRLFRFALRRGIIDATPAADIEGLDEGNGRERYLSMEEIQSLWLGLDDITGLPSVRLAIRFMLATGQRRSEVVETAWTEIDKTEALWRLPGERAKNGRPNIIPLPLFIMGLVNEAENLRGVAAPDGPKPSPYLFPAHTPDKPFDPKTATVALNRNRDKLGIGDAWLHDLRRTFATWHGEIGTPPEILSALLNHAPVTMTAKVYNRASNIEPKRRAMEEWCRWLEFVIEGNFSAAKEMQGATVLPLTEVA